MPISLGQISFGIGPDTTRLRTSISDIVNFGSAVERAARLTAAGASAGEAALRRQEAAAISALQKVQRFQDQVARIKPPANLAAGFNQLSTVGLDRFVSRMTSGQLTALQFQREMERFNQTMLNGQRIMNTWSAAQKRAIEGRFAEYMQQLSSAAVLVAGPLSGIATRLSVIASLAGQFNISWAALIAGIAGGTYAFIRMSASILNVERRLENIRMTLTAVSKSEAIASAQLGQLQKLADRTGVVYTDLAEQYAKITAASKGTNLEGEKTDKIFESIALVGAKLGLSGEAVKGTFLAIQQMMSKGRITAEELRQQLAERLPGAMQAMQEATGKSGKELDDFMRKGQLSINYLVAFSDKLRERYGIDENTKINTITAAEGRLSSARIRALDILDRVLGVSSAYKNTLDFLTSSLNTISNNTKTFVSILAGVAGAMIAAFAGPALITGLTTVVGLIRSLAGAIAAVDIALLASTWGGIVVGLGRLALALGGAVAGYVGMQMALKDADDGLAANQKRVQDYIRDSKGMPIAVKAITQSFIDQNEALRSSAIDELMQKQKLLTTAEEELSRLRAGGESEELISRSATGQTVERVKKEMQDLNDKIVQLTYNRKALNEIMAKPTSFNAGNEAEALTNRQTLAIKNATDSIRELETQYSNLFKAPAAKEWGDIQNQISKQVENFRDQLTRTELPAAKINALTEQYAEALRKVKEGQYALAHTASFFQALEGVVSKGLDTALDQFVNHILEGKDAMEALRDTGKAVAADLLKTFMTLAALNPLKNALFGTNYPVLGGSAGTGGLLGNLFNGGGGILGSLMGGGGGGPIGSIAVGNYMMPQFANGGIMTAQGIKPLRSYSRGGIARSPQYAEYGEASKAEAYVPLPDGRSIPVSLQGGGGGTEVHIHEAPGVKAETKTTKNAGGGARTDVFLRKQVTSGLLDDLMGGGEFAQALEKRYGLDRTRGMAR